MHSNLIEIRHEEEESAVAGNPFPIFIKHLNQIKM